ncbi:hypothetical protein [Paenibacillus lentus]|uniref:Fibronectin type III domain-containing protein n=1 Tax=Paenibacillus lentus TaxID=1338368 RepID=A0A3Q8S3M1_9BACL|nr:hypothetical protein [Paenibacillus lentus]AZK45176.1 hypothetical protein EIM92_02325 [Paenibacillus lentus]
MKWFKGRLQVAAIASALVVSSLAGSLSASANDSFIPTNNNSRQGVIVPYMGNERVIANGNLSVDRTWDFGNFTLNNSSVKVVWSPNSKKSNNFKLQVMQLNWLGEAYAIAQISLDSNSTTSYFTNLPVGKNLFFRVVGSAHGSISAYDWGPNN